MDDQDNGQGAAPAEETTRLLLQATAGDRTSADALLNLLYDELKAMAARQMQLERPDHTLQPTALVNEAYLRLIDQRQVQWQGRAHFCGMAAQMMRRILVDHARRRQATKRGAGARKIVLEDYLASSSQQDPLDVLALDEVLEQLATLNQRHARIVELRFFTGMSIEETAQVLGVSPATVKNDWRAARAWLMTRLREDPSPDNEASDS